MNKAKLKSYAPQARKDFIAAVTARANLLGLSSKDSALEVAASLPQGDVTVIAGQAWPVKVHGQRQQLIARIQKDGFAQTLEAVAYTWFNRFAALRYMELHDYLGHGHRALSSTEGTLPDILTHAADLAQNSSLPGLNAAQVLDMKLAGNRDGELYRMLLVAQCNALSAVMPFLFERIDDETELLLPDNLLRTDSVIAKLVVAIDEDDWKEVEIIGWLYQFYISEKKDDVIGKVVKSEDIPAATQLFTPNWIVQYLVQNSVGRLWLMANPASTLKAQWPYYIEPAQQTPEVQAQLDALIQTRMDEDGGSLNPESITLLDPACGSGHILVEAYEVLKAIYLERGYQPRSIPRLILEKNLYGLDIDDRAAQMAGFALLMKARADDRRLFNQPIKLNVMALQESKGLDAAVLTRALQTVTGRGYPLIEANVTQNEFGDHDLFPRTLPQMNLGDSSADATADDPVRTAIAALTATFAYAKTFGSLIQIPQLLNSQLTMMADGVQSALLNGDLYAKAAAQDLLPLVTQAQVLGIKFDAVVANPPYMGIQGMNTKLSEYITKIYPDGKSDLMTAFLLRSLMLLNDSGFSGLVTHDSWLFLSSYSQLRPNILSSSDVDSMLHIGWNCFPEVHTYNRGVACIFGHGNINRKGVFYDLSNTAATVDKNTLFLLKKKEGGNQFFLAGSDFKKIPGSIFAFWISKKWIDIFGTSKKLSDISNPRQGLATADNGRFLRMWSEVSLEKIKFDCTSGDEAIKSSAKWFPYNKGGAYRKWFGNQSYLINWCNNGQELYAMRPKSVIRSPSTYFKESLSWSKVTNGGFSLRYFQNGFIYDVAGCSIFVENSQTRLAILGLLNSKLMTNQFKKFFPTINLEVGQISDFPILSNVVEHASDNALNVAELVNLFREDWNYDELSWNFLEHPLININSKEENLQKTYNKLRCMWTNIVSKAKFLEEENNSYYINKYKLNDELIKDVNINEVSLFCNPYFGIEQEFKEAEIQLINKTSRKFISYIIGCMMGRYSLDAPGLIYAHACNVGFDATNYITFPADADGIVPLTDELWFDDDAASRTSEFLLAVWGADTLAENMAWLAESLGTKASETPNETIRRYLADKFYKDHLQTYKKRPIYWLFSSGKQGAFQALVYLHRYHEGTLARMRAEYVVPLTGKIQARIDMLQKDAAAASSTAARNKLAKEVEKLKKKHVELLAYDEQLRHYADMRITLDLDDGVKVNYGKFGDLLAEVKAVTGGASDE